MKRFLLGFVFLLVLLLGQRVIAFEYPPGIFVNDFPGPITVKEGEIPRIPIFLLTGPYAGQKVEFFIWREGQNLPDKEYLNSQLQWEPFEGNYPPSPTVEAELPSYVFVNWTDKLFLYPYNWENNLPPEDFSYTLYICLDAKVDGNPPTKDEFSSNPPQAVCAHADVVFTPEKEQVCEPSEIKIEGLDDGLDLTFFAGFAPHFIYLIKTNCGEPRCSLKEVPAFLKASFEENNLLLDFRSDLSPGSYNGNLVLACQVEGEKTFSFPIKVQVEPVPGSCSGEVYLKDETGKKYFNNATISLSGPKTFEVVCQQRLLVVDTESTLTAYAFSWDNPCLTAENRNGSLVLIPIEDEGCQTPFYLGVGDKRLSYHVTVEGSSFYRQECVPTLEPSQLAFFGTGTKTVMVKDSCNNSLAYRITKVSQSWIKEPKVGSSGKGELKIYVSTEGLSGGTYWGEVDLVLEDGTPLKLPISLQVPSVRTTSELTLWPTEIIESLEVGANKQVELTATCSGTIPSSCSVTKISGGSWLSVSGCEGAIVTVNLNAQGLTAGQTYQGELEVKTSCGVKNVPVKLTISGVCESSTPKVYPSKILVSSLVGSNPASQTVSVTDNCGKALSFKVSGVDYSSDEGGWLSYTTSEGKLTLSFNTSSLTVGNYQAFLTLSTDLGEVQVEVDLTVSEQPNPSLEEATFLPKSQVYRGTFASQEAKLFYFTAGATSLPLSVSVQAPSFYSFAYLNMILLNAGPDCSAAPPTVEQIKELISQYESGNLPSRGEAGNIYWNLGGGLTKIISVYNTPETCWYLLIYNSSSQSYSNVTVGYSAPEIAN